MVSTRYNLCINCGNKGKWTNVYGCGIDGASSKDAVVIQTRKDFDKFSKLKGGIGPSGKEEEMRKKKKDEYPNPTALLAIIDSFTRFTRLLETIPGVR